MSVVGMSLEQKKKLAKLVIKKEIIRVRTKEEEDIRIASETYEDLLMRYKNKPAHKYLKKKVMESPSIQGIWTSVAKLAEFCETSIEEYVHAQFWFCDKYLNRAPKVNELIFQNTNIPSIKRYELYKERSQITTNTTIVQKGGTIQVNSETKNSLCERVIRQFAAKLNLSEEEVFLKLFTEGTYYLFVDKKWFENHDHFKALKDKKLIS